MTWKSLADLEVGVASEDGQRAARALIEDEARFIDLAESRYFLTVEHTIFRGAVIAAADVRRELESM